MLVLSNVMQALNISETYRNAASGQYSVSDMGLLAYLSGSIHPEAETPLVRVDLKGGVQPVADFKAAFFAPRFSPDGQRIAYSALAQDRHVWIYDLNRGTASRLTGEGMAHFPVWTPDGKRLVFEWYTWGVPNLYWQSTDGSSPMERLTTSKNLQVAGSFTPKKIDCSDPKLPENTE